MTDDIDALLKEESNSPESQTGERAKSQTEKSVEEIEFSKLSGSTQDRIRQLIREKNEALRGAEKPTFVPPPPAPAYANSQVQDALSKLDSAGVATKDFTKQQVAEGIAQMAYRIEINRLEERYNGEDGKPKFTVEEYEDYVSRHPAYKNYLPEDVYGIMYKGELFDWETKNPSDRGERSSMTLKPTKTSAAFDEELTPEQIEERLKQSDGPEWYQKNLTKINKVLANMGK